MRHVEKDNALSVRCPDKALRDLSTEVREGPLRIGIGPPRPDIDFNSNVQTSVPLKVGLWVDWSRMFSRLSQKPI